MLGVGGYAPSVSSFTNDSPLGWQGVGSAAQNDEPAYAEGYKNAADILSAAGRGDIDPYHAQELLSNAANRSLEYRMSEEQNQYLNNLIAQYQSKHALTWQAEQLQALGLSNSGVLQTGAAHTAQDMSNPARNRADRLKSIANSLIDMTSRATGAGIHGAAIQGLKDTASDAIEGVIDTHRTQINHFDRTGRALGSTVKFDTHSRNYNRRIY